MVTHHTSTNWSGRDKHPGRKTRIATALQWELAPLGVCPIDDEATSRLVTFAGSFFSNIGGGPGGVHSDVARRCRGLLELRSYKELLDVTIDPRNYADSDAFARDWACVSLLSKYSGFDIGIDKSAVALEKFWTAEAKCKETNETWRHVSRDDTAGGASRAINKYVNETGQNNDLDLIDKLETIFLQARRSIAKVLGPCKLEKIEQYARFSGGSTTRLSRRKRDVFHKLHGNPHVSPRAHDIARMLISRAEGWYSYLTRSSFAGTGIAKFHLQPWCLVTTVPKNAKQDRVIAIEPDLNMFLQLGAGGYIRQQLLNRCGIDLNDQSHNQRGACEGSLNGSLATIDLKAASDTIAFELVRWLLPRDWFDLLNNLRSHHVFTGTRKQSLELTTLVNACDGNWDNLVGNDRIKRLEKFSSMGNGFTFELETLIFWAIADAVRAVEYIPAGWNTTELKGAPVLVYGDDVICSSFNADTVLLAFKIAGFDANEDKTFVDGPFRESCGKHYFRGKDVTPIYVRKALTSVPQLLLTANNVTRLASRLGNGLYRCATLQRAWNDVVSWLPPSIVSWGIPDGFGDGALVKEFDEALPRTHKYWGGYVVKHLREVIDRERPHGEFDPSLECFPDPEASLFRWLYNASGPTRTPIQVTYWAGYRTTHGVLPFFVEQTLTVDSALCRGATEERWEGIEMTPPPHVIPKTKKVRSWVPQWTYLGPWA